MKLLQFYAFYNLILKMLLLHSLERRMRFFHYSTLQNTAQAQVSSSWSPIIDSDSHSQKRRVVISTTPYSQTHKNNFKPSRSDIKGVGNLLKSKINRDLKIKEYNHEG